MLIFPQLSSKVNSNQLMCKIIVSIVVHFIYMTCYVLTECYILVSRDSVGVKRNHKTVNENTN